MNTTQINTCCFRRSFLSRQPAVYQRHLHVCCSEISIESVRTSFTSSPFHQFNDFFSSVDHRLAVRFFSSIKQSAQQILLEIFSHEEDQSSFN
ncbi:unnamed protein product [Adineta ricciae]|uniref:Uncharacterized protein n=1 Tax=Adineta ricciae TaxID=249248 RepID=A0A813QHI6_ADIRI|nr:unnamed protein product [Adineta ricciae]